MQDDRSCLRTLKLFSHDVTMMVPDREIGIKVKLCSQFIWTSQILRKFTVLYALCEQQLSKQAL